MESKLDIFILYDMRIDETKRRFSISITEEQLFILETLKEKGLIQYKNSFINQSLRNYKYYQLRKKKRLDKWLLQLQRI